MFPYPSAHLFVAGMGSGFYILNACYTGYWQKASDKSGEMAG
jgi:hypothetical protein